MSKLPEHPQHFSPDEHELPFDQGFSRGGEESANRPNIDIKLLDDEQWVVRSLSNSYIDPSDVADDLSLYDELQDDYDIAVANHAPFIARAHSQHEPAPTGQRNHPENFLLVERIEGPNLLDAIKDGQAKPEVIDKFVANLSRYYRDKIRQGRDAHIIGDIASINQYLWDTKTQQPVLVDLEAIIHHGDYSFSTEFVLMDAFEVAYIYAAAKSLGQPLPSAERGIKRLLHTIKPSLRSGSSLSAKISREMFDATVDLLCETDLATADKMLARLRDRYEEIS